MQELLDLRGYKHKHFDLGFGQNAAVFHQSDIHYIPPGQSTFEDVDFSWFDRGSYWEMIGASYRVFVAKDFSAPQLIRYDNRYGGANHSVYYEPKSVWWVNRFDYSIRQLFRDAQPVMGVLEGRKVVYYDAFGPGFDFVVHLRRDGVRKYMRINYKAAWGSPPSQDHWPVMLFTYEGAGLTIRADDASVDWDENSLYESSGRFKLTDGSGYFSRIQQGFVRDSDAPFEQQSVKMFFENRNSKLWQAKVLPRPFLENATYPVYADDSTTFSPGDYEWNQWNAGESTWANCRDGTSSDGYSGTYTSPDTAARCTVIDASPDTYSTWRPIMVFDTDSIVSGATVTLAKWRFWLGNIIRTVETDRGVYLVKAEMVDPTSIASGDWDAIAHGTLSWDVLSSVILHANLNTGTGSGDVNELTFNDNSWVQKGTGALTEFAFVDGHDYTDNAPTTAGGNAHSYTSLYWADAADTYDPELYVEYTPPQITKVINKTLQVSEGSLRPRVMTRVKGETVQISEDTLFAISEDILVGSGNGFCSVFENTTAPYWDTARNKSSANLSDQDELRVKNDDNGSSYAEIIRCFTPVYTGGISALYNILSAELFVYYLGGQNNDDDGNDWVTVVQTFQASPTALVNADYDDCGDSLDNPTEGVATADRLDLTGLSTGWYSWKLDATGLSWIARNGEQKPAGKTAGWTHLGLRGGHDCVDDVPSGNNAWNGYYSGHGTYPPYLRVTYAVTGTDLLRIIGETLNISEGSLRSRVMARIINETVQASEGSVRSRILIRILNSVLNLGEGSLRPRVLARVVDEDENISEATLRPRVMTRVINSTVNLAEGIVDILTPIGLSLVKVISSTVNLVEGTLRPRVMSRVINEDENVSESTLRPRVMLRVKGETVQISEDGLFAITETFPVSVGDGNVFAWASGWSTVQGASSGNNASYTETYIDVQSGHDTPWGNYYIGRGFFPTYVDISGLSAIISAKLWVYIQTVTNADNDGNDFMRIVQTDQPSTSQLTTSDYNNCGAEDNPTGGSSDIDLSNFSAASWYGFSLNATGLSWIPKSGWAMLGMREGHDCKDDSIATDTENRLRITSYEGASNNPYLELTYTLTGSELLRVINETLNIGEGSLRSRVMARIINESLQVAEGSLRSRVLNRIINSVLNLTEGHVRARVMNRVVDETVEISEDMVYGLTTRFYGSSGDGFTYMDAEATWDDAKDNPTLYAYDDGAYITSRTSFVDPDYGIWRLFYPFYTPIPSGATILSAVLGASGYDGLNTDTHDYGCAVVTSGQASGTDLVASDHNTVGFTPCSPYITFAALNTSGYNLFVLNPTGLAHIKRTGEGSPSGWSMFAILEGHDIKDEAPDGFNRMRLYAEEQSGTSDDPYLEVTYTITATQLLKIINETLNIGEGSLRSRVMARIINESLQVAEGSLRSRVLNRIINSVLNLTEGHVRARVMNRVVDETEQVAEGSLRSRVMSRVVDEGENVSETVLRPRVMTRVINSTVNLVEGIVDVLTYVGVVLIKVINEVVNISKTVLRPRVMSRVVDETENLSEGTVRARVMSRIVDEDENIVETPVRARVLSRVVNSTVNIAEGIVDVLTYIGQLLIKVIADTLNISETKNKTLGFIKVVDETLNISESGLRYRDLIRSIDEVVNLLESGLRARALIRIESDVVNLSETATKAMSLVKIIADAVNLSENLVKIRGIIKVIADVLQISEVVNWIKDVPDAIKLIVSSVFRRVVSKTSARSDTVSQTSTFDKTVVKSSQFQRVLSFESKFETEEL